MSHKSYKNLNIKSAITDNIPKFKFVYTIKYKCYWSIHSNIKDNNAEYWFC